MTARGKLIVLEGIDGSGKRTQLEMLARAFEKRGLPHARVAFPNYNGNFGKRIARFLNGDFGSLDQVNPYFSALLYAGDRLESKPALEAALASGKSLLSDRYIASNLAHQGARVAEAKRGNFLEWLRNLEYQLYGLPPEDLVIYLRVPADVARQMIDKKAKREYTELQRDLQEADQQHLETAAAIYEELARQANWAKIECVDGSTGAMRSPAAIQGEIVAAIEAKVFAPQKVSS